MGIAWLRAAGLGIAITAATSATSTALAQSGAWGPRAFCTLGDAPNGGTGSPNCAYYSWEQCMASASGTGNHCTANPFYKGAAKGEKAPRKRRPQG
jgi:hypothetical protein